MSKVSSMSYMSSETETEILQVPPSSFRMLTLWMISLETLSHEPQTSCGGKHKLYRESMCMFSSKEIHEPNLCVISSQVPNILMKKVSADSNDYLFNFPAEASNIVEHSLEHKKKVLFSPQILGWFIMSQ